MVVTCSIYNARLLLTISGSLVVLFVELATRVGGIGCGPRLSARLLMEIPCDMSKSSFCATPGSAYPWHSVRRYIFENQGLMRRMYGDERHSIVMSNEIDLQNLRYESTWPENGREGAGRSITILKLNRRRPSSLNSTLSTPSRAAPTTRAPNGTTPVTSTATSVSTPPDTTLTSSDQMASETVTDMQTDDTTTLKTVSAIANPTTSTSDDLSTTASDHRTVTSGTSTSMGDTTLGTSSTSATSTITTLLSTSPEMTTSVASSKVPTTTPSLAASQSSPSTFTTTTIITTSADPLDSDSEDAYSMDYEAAPRDEEDSNIVEGKEEMEDVDVERGEEDPVVETLPRRGMNACPVKNEMVAPYWANNTRGETLALLNVYPFEQYVHFEKCAFENHQMMCREGCRCEQQYRLHRLLAFDPKNECRGIFSDWFRFPSCCVCICYDVPQNFPNVRGRTGRTD